MSHELYRYYDANDALLYVGISSDAVARHKEHEAKSWRMKVCVMTVERFNTREQLEEAERIAVFREKPIHNVNLQKGERQPKHGNGIGAYLDKHFPTAKDRQAFARAAGLSPMYLQHLIAGRKKKATMGTILGLIRASEGGLTFKDIRPDLGLSESDLRLLRKSAA